MYNFPKQQAKFQFHTGSIRRQKNQFGWSSQMGFNSILVRLEDYYHASVEAYQKFQFHTGSIRRFTRASQRGQLLRGFNSILVRLEVEEIQRTSERDSRFNSKLVRLEDTWRVKRDTQKDGFNSILVRLEASITNLMKGTSARFNSKLVRLEAH